MDAQTALDLFSKEMLAYDSHVGHNDMFYYSLPYERNYELTNSIPIAPVSGNVIKFYQYRMDKPVIIFTDVVDTTAEEAEDVNEEEMADGFEEGLEGEEMLDENGEPRELSEDEMAALLTADQPEEEAGEEMAESYDDEEVYDKAPSSAAPVDDYDDEEVYDKAPSGAAPESWDAPEF